MATKFKGCCEHCHRTTDFLKDYLSNPEVWRCDHCGKVVTEAQMAYDPGTAMIGFSLILLFAILVVVLVCRDVFGRL